MQRSGAATRRFHAAFYQLTVHSANPTTRPCLAGAGLVSRRANSHTSESSKRYGAMRSRSHKRLHMKSFAGTIELLQEEPIQSAAERPFGSLEAWGHAVRERSLSSVTVEVSVPGRLLPPQNVIENIETREVQVRILEHNNGEGDYDLRPVLLSGNPVKVKEAWETLHHTGSYGPTRQTSPTVSQSTEVSGPEPWKYTLKEGEAGNYEVDFYIPEPAWLPLAEHGCVQWFQQEHQVQTDVLNLREGCAHLRLQGHPKTIRKVVKFLQKARKWTDEQAQGRYQFIRHSLDNDLASSPVLINEPRAKESGPERLNEVLAKTEKPRASSDKKKETQDQSKNQANQQLGDELRSALRHLTQPVALITSTMPGECSGELADGGPRGVTVSSFCTVTLHPTPIISFNLRVPSRTWDAIKASKRLSVSLLAASPQGATAAHAFTLPYEQPHEPFKRLEALGASVKFRNGKSNPPDITWREAVYTKINADLLWRQCVRVGDHIIVVAKVTDVRHDESSTDPITSALAYGMRGYRSLGGEIKPMEGEAAAPKVEPVKPVKTESAKTKSTKAESAMASLAKEKPVEEKPAKERSVKRKSVQSESAAVAGTNGQGQSKDIWEDFMEDFVEDLEKNNVKPADMQGPSALTDHVLQPDGQAYKDLEDIGPSSPILDEESLRQALEEPQATWSAEGLPSQTANRYPMLAKALSAAAGAYVESPDAAITSPTTSTSQTPDSTIGRSMDASHNNTTSNPQGADYRPWGISGNTKPPNRNFSTWTRSHTRRYSTSKNPEDTTPKKILKSTVDDYLCQIPTNNRLYNNLIAAQRQAEKLEKLVASGKVPSEGTDEVKNEAQTIRRRVARELAWRNAQDLRVLLDQGHVNPERAQWLETNLERGQAILLQEATILRAELEEGRVVKEEFEGTKAALMKDYEEFEALLKRLRDFVDEDDVGVGEGEQEPGSPSSGRP